MLSMTDVVLTTRRDGDERVILRGAQLRVTPGEVVVISGVDAEGRHALRQLIAGMVRPRYGSVARTATDPALAPLVMDVGDELDEEALRRLTTTAKAPVVVLAGARPGPHAADPGSRPIRRLELRGGRFLPAAGPAGPVREPADTGGEPVACVPAPLVLSAEELSGRVVATLRDAGVPDDHAHTVARVLVDAERRGHRSHGVALLPTYLQRIRAGGIVPDAQPRFTHPTPSVALVDAGGGLGQVAADRAARWCAEAAAQHAVAVAAVSGNNHVGMLAAYRKPFQEHEAFGLLLNVSGPSVCAPGAVRATLGSNALCLVTPQPGAPEPFCVDMATGVVAAGKIRDALNRATTIPETWLLDAAGRPTTDPSQLDAGGSVPLFGGYKGLGVSLIVEMLAGALAGGRVSPDVAKQRKQLGEVMGCGQLFVGLSARHFSQDRTTLPFALVDRLREAVAAGYDTLPEGPWFPDQPEERSVGAGDAAGLRVPGRVVAVLGWGTSA